MPSSVLRKSGSTPNTPSVKNQYCHIGTFGWTFPLDLIETSFGKSSISQNDFTHGPAPIMTWSHLTVPLSVSTPVTAFELEPYSNPVTVVPDNILTPSASAFVAKP